MNADTKKVNLFLRHVQFVYFPVDLRHLISFHGVRTIRTEFKENYYEGKIM